MKDTDNNFYNLVKWPTNVQIKHDKRYREKLNKVHIKMDYYSEEFLHQFTRKRTIEEEKYYLIDVLKIMKDNDRIASNQYKVVKGQLKKPSGRECAINFIKKKMTEKEINEYNEFKNEDIIEFLEDTILENYVDEIAASMNYYKLQYDQCLSLINKLSDLVSDKDIIEVDATDDDIISIKPKIVKKEVTKEIVKSLLNEYELSVKHINRELAD